MKKYLVATALVLSSCSMQQVESPQIETTLQRVQMDFTLTQSITKSSYSGVAEGIDDINLWIYRDGLPVEHIYLDHPGSSISVGLVKGDSYSFYALANMYSDLSSRVDYMSQREQAFCLSLRVSLSDFSLGNPGRNMPMAASKTDFMVTGSRISLDLERLLSKVAFRFAPDDGLRGQNISIQSVRVRGSAQNITPFTSRSYSSEVSDGDIASSSDITLLNAGGQVVEFYCLENCCGISSNTDPDSKTPEGAPHGHPTYLEVTAGLDGGDLGGSLTYRFCIGQNNTNDYNLLRNHIYTVTLNSLTSSVEDGEDSWKIDSGEVYYNGVDEQVSLYVGQFGRLALNAGDEVRFFNQSTSKWEHFVSYDEGHAATMSLSNGMCLISQPLSNANNELYFYSTGSSGSPQAAEKLMVRGADGSRTIYQLDAPVVPSGFATLSTISVREDGLQNSSIVPNITGTLGIAPISSFRIPDERYAAASYALSKDHYAAIADTTFASCAMPTYPQGLWAAIQSAEAVESALLRSSLWGLFYHLYIEDIMDSVGFPSDYLGCYLDCLSDESTPSLCFYGLDDMTSRTVSLTNTQFSQDFTGVVTMAFPGSNENGTTGYIATVTNYELAPNNLFSTFAGVIPEGSPTSWSITGPSTTYIKVTNRRIEFTFPKDGPADDVPACGRYFFTGQVTNPYSGRLIKGRYYMDVILYLPLIASVKLTTFSSSSTVFDVAVAVGSDRYYHANAEFWASLLAPIFSDYYYEPQYEHMGLVRNTIQPSGVSFTVTMPYNRTTYESGSDIPGTIQWMSQYACARLKGFHTRFAADSSLQSEFTYSFGSTNNSLNSWAHYVQCVRMEDVNTTITPAYNYYGKGKYFYESLWGSLRSTVVHH